MTTETIIAQTWGDQGIITTEHAIDVKPVTLVCPDADILQVTYPDRLELSLTETTYHAERVKGLHSQFSDAWNVVFGGARMTPPEPIPDQIRQMGLGYCHLMGLIDLTLKLTDQGIPIVWKHPETGLHPRLQAALADLLIYLIPEK